MAFVNLEKREISFKVVYYGPPLSGKTTNLEQLHRVMPGDARGDMTMLATGEDRTLYFDFLPLRSDVIKGFVSRFQLYTVPGQPIYNQTRKLVLAAVDALVFVADSQWTEMENNADSFANLQDNLRTYNRKLSDIPYLLQFNKRDLPDIAPVQYLDFMLNQLDTKAPFHESIATEGTGVVAGLNTVCKMAIAQFVKDNNMEISSGASEEVVGS
jgi:signal recognition particle receptor subunit beta